VTRAQLLMRILFIHAFFFTHFLLVTFLFTRFLGGGGRMLATTRASEARAMVMQQMALRRLVAA
jgi:hypothetical protein